jgi:hypothetical protein
MKCFVSEFDDVHMAIEAAVSSVKEPRTVQCLRLDDDQRGGRIVGRLEQELRDCDMCVADLSGNRCNVMWEVGYAMALGKPVILVSHGEIILHFDLHDVQHVQYERAQLRRTLTDPLAKAVKHTVQHLLNTPTPNAVPGASSDRIEKMESQLHVLQDMVQQLVQKFVQPPPHQRTRVYAPPIPKPKSLASNHADFEGAWFNAESGSYIYVRFISGQMVAPYCFGGNDSLTGVYHSLQEVGNFLHARFEWIHSPIRGFSLLEVRSKDVLAGAWWMDEECDISSTGLPSLESGAQALWTRQKSQRAPKWALDFFSAVEKLGLDGAMTRLRE